MQSMYFLIPISLFFFVVGIFAVYYAVRTRQFDDLDNEAQRVILDDRQLRRQQLAERAAKPASKQASTASPIYRHLHPHNKVHHTMNSAILLAAFSLGLFGSPHCLGMCGAL
ncbi:Uncharacterized protein, possibly involved in nitrogen fixation [Moraxella atlantae]|uniref:Uncharacterized protein, possibly involved in nitrogen fixation n=1 Tax=Faucicola atlantae TaxID=34059 RepID=A0A378QLQ7_9GAMM|nr:cbb3-type cytochrome oxidase assembly protein CcoS [Moraxella atlantae]STZ01775.1 Uncharacterized protein, possibly involved in nitrogen fixation [Moraxella atlantae]